MKSATKVCVGLYATISLCVLLYLTYTNNIYTPKTIGQFSAKTLYSDKFIYSTDENDYYKEINKIKENILGFRTITASIATLETDTIFHTAYFVLFTKNNTFLSYPRDDDKYKEMIETDIVEAAQQQYPKLEFFKVIYEDGKFVCTSSIDSHTTTCREIIR